jgi:hypothetical protein
MATHGLVSLIFIIGTQLLASQSEHIDEFGHPQVQISKVHALNDV